MKHPFGITKDSKGIVRNKNGRDITAELTASGITQDSKGIFRNKNGTKFSNLDTIKDYPKVTKDTVTVRFEPYTLVKEVNMVNIARTVVTAKRAELEACKKEVVEAEKSYGKALTALDRAIKDAKV